MTLLVFEHAARVTSVVETGELFHQLGSKTVTASGWVARDRAAIGALVSALVPTDDDTVSFSGGTLDDASFAALAAVVAAKPGYVDVRDDRWCNLRVWPDHAWVQQGRGEVAEYDAAHVGDAVAHWRSAATPSVEGYVMHVTKPAKAVLPALLVALRGVATAKLDVRSRELAALAAAVPFDALEVQDDMVVVRLPAGTITKYATRATESQVPKWRARVDKALAKIR